MLERYGPSALILGASEGTGREFALQLAADGIAPILIARRAEPLATLAAELQDRFHVASTTATIDLSATDAVEQIVEIAADQEVGLMIYNAGGDPNGEKFLDCDLGAWQALIRRNVDTMMDCCYRFAAPMRARGRGGLLLVNSGACYGGASTMGPYSGSKAFMLGFAEGLWADLRGTGVDVLTLVLGRTDTPELRRFLAAKNMPLPPDAVSSADVARIGLERLPYGPIHNIGQADDQRGNAPQSPAERRARVVAASASIDALYGGSSS